jgi:hypothetical protein
MTLAELNAILRATGFPVAYSHFNSEVIPPYIVYLVSSSPNFIADDAVYKKIDDVQIELYTELKDPAVEAIIEDILDAHEMPYESSEMYIESEKLFQKIYEVRLMR